MAARRTAIRWFVATAAIGAASVVVGSPTATATATQPAPILATSTPTPARITC